MVDPESPASAPGLLARAKLIAASLVVLLLVGAVLVLVMRAFQARALGESTAIHAVQYVVTTQPGSGGGVMPVTLPGTLQGLIESTVYARSSGYLVRWTKDIGATVKKGDLLAEVAAPEIDQQLYQAQAALAQSASSEALARTTAERWQSLRAKDAVTQQELDERTSAYQQAKADLQAAGANVSRLRSLQGFNRVTAPFDGVLTRRNAIIIFMSVELMLNSVNLLLAAFSSYKSDPSGQIFVFFIMAVAAAEVAVGLAIIVMIYRNIQTIDVGLLNKLKW